MFRPDHLPISIAGAERRVEVPCDQEAGHTSHISLSVDLCRRQAYSKMENQHSNALGRVWDKPAIG